MNPARTRFAPSPTGFLHVGGIRTALFAWLIARQTGGQFILRIEDTDQGSEVRGSAEVIDDFILMKSDGFPTYNFAHIVDDYLMGITHVIRSQEFLPSVPRYLNLYEALGIARPLIATVPFVMGPDGKKKLSKRDGAK